MPPRSKVLQLPAELREELDKRLVARGFGGYVDLSEWLAGQGYQIGKSSLHVYGTDLERRIESIRLATEQAEALLAASPDDSGAMADSSLRLVQERIFQLMLTADGGDLKELAAAARALAEVARASISVRSERRKVLAEAAEKVRDEGRKHGLSDEALDAIDSRLMPAD